MPIGVYPRKIHTLEELFWRKVSKPDAGCWEWQAHRTVHGYGQLRYGGKLYIAPRVSYELNVGPIGKLHVLHRCDNPACVRPDHLFLGTPKDNALDKSAKGRSTWGEKSSSAKLSAVQIQEIRLACASSKRGTQTAIAKRFGVTQSHISRICSKEVWGKLEGEPDVY